LQAVWGRRVSDRCTMHERNRCTRFVLQNGSDGDGALNDDF
jgi:hypothetical protein